MPSAFLYANLGFGTKSIASCIPLSSVSTICHPTCLPTYLQLVSLSSLHCHASLRVFSNREESFPPLRFLSLLVPLVFPNAFFTCLGPTILLVSHACLGFGTSRCYWTIDIPRHPHTRLVLASCHSSPPLSIPFCPSILLLFVLNASGHRILFISPSPICFCVCSPCCLKLVSVLLYISIALLLSGHVWKQSSPCCPSVFTCLSPLFSPCSILSFLPDHCYSSLRLLGEEWVSWPPVFLFGGRMGFMVSYVSLCFSSFVQVSLLVSHLLWLSLCVRGET